MSELNRKTLWTVAYIVLTAAGLAPANAAPALQKDVQVDLQVDLARADTNGDGKLSKEEVIASMTASITAQLKGQLGDQAQVVARQNAAATAKRLFDMFDKNGDGFLGADETPAQGNNGNPGQANGQFPPEKVFTVKLAANRNIGVIYNDRQSDVVVLLLPGANQDKALARNYNMLAPGFNKLGYSTASIYTNFGPLVDSGGRQNNKHLLRVMSAIKRRYGNREFILYGGSNGGRSALQAAERSRRGICAVIAHPAVYLPKRNMKGLPVYLRIGAKDGLGWAKYFDRMSQGLTRLGAKVDAKLVPNAGHIPMADMSQIGPWLKKHEIEPGKVAKP